MRRIERSPRELNPYAGYLTFEDRKAREVLKDAVGHRLPIQAPPHWTKHRPIEFGFFGASTRRAPPPISTRRSPGRADQSRLQLLQWRGAIVVVAFASGGAGLVRFYQHVSGSPPIRMPSATKVEISYNVGGGIRFFGGRRAGFRTGSSIGRTSASNGVDIQFLGSSPPA